MKQDDRIELKFYIEDLQSEDIEALLSVRIFKNDKVMITGKKPSHVVSTTCAPYDIWSEEERTRIDAALAELANILRERFLKP